MTTVRSGQVSPLLLATLASALTGTALLAIPPTPLCDGTIPGPETPCYDPATGCEVEGRDSETLYCRYSGQAVPYMPPGESVFRSTCVPGGDVGTDKCVTLELPCAWLVECGPGVRGIPCGTQSCTVCLVEYLEDDESGHEARTFTTISFSVPCDPATAAILPKRFSSQGTLAVAP